MTNADLRALLAEARSWIRACLDCKDYEWDGDQRECAEGTVASITAALAEKDGGWLPIETAPRDNKRMLYLASIVDGELRELDFDGIWQSESESWEMPEVYYYWASASGIEEPTHWAYQDQPLPPLPQGD